MRTLYDKAWSLRSKIRDLQQKEKTLTAQIEKIENDCKHEFWPLLPAMHECVNCGLVRAFKE